MLNFAAAIAAKDLRMALHGANGFCQALLLGLLLIFIFSLSTPPGEHMSPQAAAAIFWLSSAFCQILIFNHLYALEEANLARQALLLAPAPIQGIWLGKALAGLSLIALAQAALLPAAAAFLGQSLAGPAWPCIAALGAADFGMAVLGSLMGALAHGQSGRESLLSIIIFPLLLPLLLAAISLTAQTLGAAANASPQTWLGVALAFDAIFLSAGLILFGFLYEGDE